MGDKQLQFTRICAASGIFALLWAGNATALAASTGSEKAYPVKPIRVIIPQSAGGSTDLAARAVTQRIGDALGHPFVVDNRPGAGSLIGTDLVAKAAPDGYTLLGVAGSFSINPSLHARLPFDPVRDFDPISRLCTLPHILVVHPAVPARSVKELIALIKERAGRINVATSGVATSTHMAAELFMYMTGTKMTTVPYKGGAPGIVALVGGEVQLSFATISTALPHIRSGKLRALAVTTRKRSAAVPDYPTISEAGLPGYEHASWVGLLAPAGTAPAIIARLNGEIARIVHLPEVKDYFFRDGLEPDGDSAKEFTASIRSEIAKWRNVVKAAGIKPQ
jgi:tripartite-type tricarboxylate transporter receptor subunit TctC